MSNRQRKSWVGELFSKLMNTEPDKASLPAENALQPFQFFRKPRNVSPNQKPFKSVLKPINTSSSYGGRPILKPVIKPKGKPSLSIQPGRQQFKTILKKLALPSSLERSPVESTAPSFDWFPHGSSSFLNQLEHQPLVSIPKKRNVSFDLSSQGSPSRPHHSEQQPPKSTSEKFDVSLFDSFLHEPPPSFLFQSKRHLLKPTYNSKNRQIGDADCALSIPYNQPSKSIPKKTDKSADLVDVNPSVKAGKKRKANEDCESDLFVIEKEFNDTATEAKRKKQVEYLEKLQLICERKIVRECLLDEDGDDEGFKFDVPVVREPRKRAANESMLSEPASKMSKVDSAVDKEPIKVNLPDFTRSFSAKWDCPTCMAQNDDDKTECPCCGTSKPGSVDASKTPEAPKPAFKPTTFQVSNDASALFGVVAKPAETTELKAPESSADLSVSQAPTTSLFGTAKAVETKAPESSADLPTSQASTTSSFGAAKSVETKADSSNLFGAKPVESKISESNLFGTAKSVEKAGSKTSGSTLFGTAKSVEATESKVPEDQKPSLTFPSFSTTSASNLFGAKPVETKVPEDPKPSLTFPSFPATSNASNLFGAKPAETKVPEDPKPSLTFPSFSTTNATGLFGVKPVEVKVPEDPKPSLTFPSFSTTNATGLFGTAKPVETKGPEVSAPFSFGAPTVSATLPSINTTTAFNFGGATTSNDNPFTFTSNAQATDNSSNPFVFGSTTQATNVPAQSTSAFSFGSTTQTTSVPAQSTSAFNFGSTAQTTAGGAIGRRKLIAKRRKHA